MVINAGVDATENNNGVKLTEVVVDQAVGQYDALVSGFFHIKLLIFCQDISCVLIQNKADNRQ